MLVLGIQFLRTSSFQPNYIFKDLDWRQFFLSLPNNIIDIHKTQMARTKIWTTIWVDSLFPIYILLMHYNEVR